MPGVGELGAKSRLIGLSDACGRAEVSLFRSEIARAALRPIAAQGCSHRRRDLLANPVLCATLENRRNANNRGGGCRNTFENAVAESRKGPPLGEPFLILRRVRHQTNGCWLVGPDFGGTGIWWIFLRTSKGIYKKIS